jgi:hypothetical protein
MAIYNTAITTTAVAMASGSGTRAVTTIIVCNKAVYNPSNPTAGLTNLYLYAVPAADVSGGVQDKHLIVNGLPVPAGETVSLDQEKLVLENSDAVFAKSETGSPENLVITVSTLAV